MNTLIIDTSTERALLAFAHGVDLLLKYFFPPGYQSSRYLMPSLESGIKELNFEPEAIAVTVGPGSYTGIRVGVASAKGLAFPRSLPLIGICSLEGFISKKEGRFASFIDARVGGAYVMLQERKGDQITPLTSPQLVSNEDLDAHLSGCQEVVGPHVCAPDPVHLARLASQKLQAKEYRSDLELIYLRTCSKSF